MNCDKKHMLLYAVTDRAWLKGQTLPQQVEAALRGGATCVQLREKKLPQSEFLKEALELKDLCHRPDRRAGAPRRKKRRGLSWRRRGLFHIHKGGREADFP